MRSVTGNIARSQVPTELTNLLLKTYQRETKLLEFSRDRDRDWLKIRKNEATIQWLCCNGFRFSVCLRLKTKLYLSALRAIPKNIGPSSRTSKLIKMQH